MPEGIDVSQILTDLHAAGSADGFVVKDYGQLGEWPLLILCRKSASERHCKNIYLSGGIHGDEPVGPLVFLEILKEHALPPSNHYYICPLMNPIGMDSQTRGNRTGIDLNRDYTDFASEEIAAHHNWLQQHLTTLDLSLHLHEDWEAQGFYLYELNFGKQRSLAAKMLRAARSTIPIEPASWIDGHRAFGGIISPPKLPDVPEGLPEAIYIQKHYGGQNYTLETPSMLPLEQRVKAMKAAVLAGISSLR